MAESTSAIRATHWPTTLPPLHYATYFDRHYLTRGLALHESLVAHSPPFTLWVLCLDETTEAVLKELRLPAVEMVPLADLERANPQLPAVRPGRTDLEYYWTLTPAWLLHLFERQPRIELLTYLDADLFFFDDPTPVYEELGAGAIMALPSRYSPYNRRLGWGSRFSVSFNVFRRSAESLSCLRRWREQCLEWCFEQLDHGRYGDQNYLDDWPELYPSFVAVANVGAGLGPWSLGARPLAAPGGCPHVDGVPVVFFHFGKLRIVRPWLYEPCFWTRRAPLTPVARYALCVPYIRELRRASKRARAVNPAVPRRDVRPRRLRQISVPQMLLQRTFLIVTDSFAL